MNHLSIILRPLVAFALFFCAAVIAHWVGGLIPSSRARTFLTRRMRIIPRSEAERRDWSPVLWLVAASLLLLVVVGYFDPLRKGG